MLLAGGEGRSPVGVDMMGYSLAWLVDVDCALVCHPRRNSLTEVQGEMGKDGKRWEEIGGGEENGV